MYSPMPLSYDATDDARRLKLAQAIADRGRAAVCASQAHAWLLLELAMATDDALQAERAAAQPPMLSAGETLLTRAVVHGALRPDEAITLFRRSNR